MKLLLTISCIIENFNKVAGIALNLLLLYLISKYSRSSLGTYKYLLIVFASSDVLLTIVHGCVNHQIVSVGSTFASVACTFIESRNITAIYCASFTLVFLLSIFNFLYRFWAVKHPHLVQLFAKKWFVALLVIVAASTFFSWYALCVMGATGDIDEIGTIVAREEYRRRFGITLTDGFLVLDHWRDGKFNLRAALVLLACDTTIISCISFVVIFAFLCFNHIRKTDKLSEQTRRLQSKLLVTLCAQTAVPIAFVFIPYFAVNNLPFFDIDGHDINVCCTALISLFPTCDAMVIIWLMNDYRNGLKLMIIGKKASVTTVESTYNISSLNDTTVHH